VYFSIGISKWSRLLLQKVW